MKTLKWSSFGVSRTRKGAQYIYFPCMGRIVFCERDPDMRLISSHLDWHENPEMVQNWGFKNIKFNWVDPS